MPITHVKVLTVPDGADTDQVRPSDWNAEHVGGDTFNGGTITEPLIIEGPIGGDPDPMLDVQGDRGEGVETLFKVVADEGEGYGVRGGATGLTVVGALSISADAGAILPTFVATNTDNSGAISLAANGVIGLTAANDDTVVQVETNGTLHLGGGATVSVTPDGWFSIESLGEDPDDADILGASMILYLDRTVGAPKLKIRAKDFNGSVFVGEVELTSA